MKSRFQHCTILLMFLLFTTPFVHGFCPKNGDWICLKGGVGQTHESITRSAVTAIDKDVFGKDKLTASMEKALQQMIDNNAAVDENQHIASLHVDGESFDEAQTRLSNAKQTLEQAISRDDAELARSILGISMHTIQDFYSHSNWVELGNGGPNPSLGRGGPIAFAGPSDATCFNCLPTLPPDICLDCLLNLKTSQLTSGYYSGEDHKKPFLGLLSGKCSHGGLSDNSTFIPPNGGINKDTILCIASPHFFLHSTAADVAVQATKQFILDIKADITDKQFRELMGVGPTLAMAIDDTGSMGDIIGQVQAQAAQIVDSRVGTDDEASNYVLVPINDPFDGPVLQANNPDDFKADIFSLFASGGGDCPELQNGGTFQAVDASEEGGDVFMFTDADSKDGDLADAVANLAATKNIQVYPMVFGNCSGFSALLGAPLAGSATFTVDPSYEKWAQVSGGQLFALQRFEAGNVSRLAAAVVHANAAQLLSTEDTLTGTPKTYSIPVDSTLSEITFSVSGATDVSVTRPDGSIVMVTDPDVTFIGLSSGAVYTIATPAVGNWAVAINGNGLFSTNISGVSTFAIRSAHFVEVRGRTDHLGLFNIPGFPVFGVDNDLRIDLSDAPATANFDLRSKAGNVLQTFTATQDTNAPQTFFGAVTIPNDPFLVYVTGKNAVGENYQRVLSAMFKPQTVKLVPPPGENIPPGKTSFYTFAIQNSGASDTFTIAAKDNRSFFSGLSTSSLNVPANGTATFKLALTVPFGTPLATVDTLTVTISGVSSGGSNFAIVQSTVENVNAQPPDCSLAAPSVATLWPPNKSFVPVSVLGVTDPQGENITINIDRVLQDEPPNGVGQGNACPAASGINTATAQLLSDRSGNGDGRVYHVQFTATNDSGLSCQSEVKVTVPHDQGNPAVDEGASFDSTVCTPQ